MSDNRIIECMERAQYLLGNLMAVKPGEGSFNRSGSSDRRKNDPGDGSSGFKLWR